jgi:hypothetical protein
VVNWFPPSTAPFFLGFFYLFSVSNLSEFAFFPTTLTLVFAIEYWQQSWSWILLSVLLQLLLAS